MKSVSINGIARVDLGKKFAKQLRKDNHVPCVLYGGKEDPIHFYAHSNEFRKIVYTPNVYLVDIVVGDNQYKSIMGDIQFHPVTDHILHIDFLRIFDNQPITINIPIMISGNSIGVRNGGRLALNMRRVLIEALENHLPENVEIDITDLKIGQSVRILDLSRENITFLNNPNDVIVAVKTARAAIVEEEIEEAGDDSEDATKTSEDSSSEEQDNKKE